MGHPSSDSLCGPSSPSPCQRIRILASISSSSILLSAMTWARGTAFRGSIPLGALSWGCSPCHPGFCPACQGFSLRVRLPVALVIFVFCYHCSSFRCFHPFIITWARGGVSNPGPSVSLLASASLWLPSSPSPCHRRILVHYFIVQHCPTCCDMGEAAVRAGMGYGACAQRHATRA